MTNPLHFKLVLDQAQKIFQGGDGVRGAEEGSNQRREGTGAPSQPCSFITTRGPSAMFSPQNDNKHSRFRKQHFWEDTRLSPQLPATKWVLSKAEKWIQLHPAPSLDKPELIHPGRDPWLCRPDPSFPPSKLVQRSLRWHCSRKSNQYIKQKSSQNSSNWPSLTFS